MKLISFLVIFAVFSCSELSVFSQKHKYGEPRQLFQFHEDNSLIFENDILEKLLLDDKVRKRKIVVLSFTGSETPDKRILMDYSLRFLYANYKSLRNIKSKPKKDWLGDKDQPLTGFSSGLDQGALGIKTWSDVFLHETDEGKEIAIIVLNTQGLFDGETLPQENSKAFTLSFLISSVQIFNVLGGVEEEHLKYLKLATRYSKFAGKQIDDENLKGLQHILFLVRYWNSPTQFPFGYKGGKTYLDNILETRDDQEKTLKTRRESITSSFEKISCFLMPSPGKSVATSADFDGSWGSIEKEFMANLKVLIPSLLAPKNLVTKKFNGREIRAQDLYKAINSFATTFSNSPKLPKLSDIYKSTVETNQYILMEMISLNYQDNILAVAAGKSEHELDKLHEKFKKSAMAIFHEAKKYIKNADQYESQISFQIDDMYSRWSSTQKRADKRNAQVNENRRQDEHEEDRDEKVEL